MITFFLIGNLVILGLGVSQAADNAKVVTRKSMNPAVSYEADYEKYWKDTDEIREEFGEDADMPKFPAITRVEAEEIAKDPRVKAYNAMDINRMYSKGFENVPVGNEAEKGEHGGGGWIDENGVEHIYVEPNLTVLSNIAPNMIEIANGEMTVINGRFYDQADIDGARQVCLVSKELAELNGFTIGDTIEIQTIQPDEIQNEIERTPGLTEDDFSYTLEIIGIYNTIKDVDPAAQNFEWMDPSESPKNMVLCPSSSLLEKKMKLAEIQFERARDEGWLDEGETFEDYAKWVKDVNAVVYLLNDPLEVESFVEDYEGKLPEYTRLNANNETFKKMARPLDTLSFFSNIVVWIVIINAIVIISLVTALTLKTRQYEMGVLVSIGVSKMKVVAQLFYELILIAIIGFAFASVSGTLMAGQVGDMVLNYQTEANAKYEDGDDMDGGWGWNNTDAYFTEITQEDLLEQYHVTVSPALIGEIYLLGAGVVLLAIIVPSFMIMRLNPKQILLEQN